jgi:hypothetical protein
MSTTVAIYEVMTESEIQRFAEYVKKKAIRLNTIRQTEIDTANEKETERLLKQEQILSEEVEILYGFLLAARNMKEVYEKQLENTVNQYQSDLNESKEEIEHLEKTLETFSSIATTAVKNQLKNEFRGYTCG